MLVAVPGIAVDAQGALLRVVIVPRLSGRGEELAGYGMSDWPALVAGARAEVRLRDAAGQDLAPVPDVPVRSEGSSVVWRAFFDRVTVTPFAGTRAYGDTVVTRTGEHARSIDGAYRATATAVGDPGEVERALRRLELPEPPPAPDPKAAVPAFRAPDFHRVVAVLRQHPRVLRALGLIVELTIPRDRFDAAGARGQVAVAWPGAPAEFEVATSPWTAFAAEDGRFFAAPTRMIAEGLVDLTTTTPIEVTEPGRRARVTQDEPDWATVCFDVDGAMARLSDAREAAAPAVMPALRTAGLQLLHRRRGGWMPRRAAAGRRGVRRAAIDGPPLDAEQLLLGYRVDVRRVGGAWFSLMRRTAAYWVNGLAIGGGPLPEEGHVAPAAAVRGTDDEVRADEIVVRWDGWHLGVPPPRLDGTSPPEPEPHPDMPYDFRWDHSLDTLAPALPELRFGRSYQWRLRAVDIAGGGLEAREVPGDVGAAASAAYRRYEPVPPPVVPPPPGLVTTQQDPERPVVVDDALLGPGGAVDRLVVRSDPAGAEALGEYPPNDERVLLPPPAPFAIVEQHDRLNGDDEATWRLARRALAAPRAAGERRAGRTWTWVPDPGADGVSVTGLPRSARTPPTPPRLRGWYPEGGGWPDTEAKGLKVVLGRLGDPLEANWDDHETAVVRVPPAMRATVEVASYVESEFGRFAAELWITGVAAATEAVGAGRHPMITPPHRIDVVHAVRMPLAAPAGTLSAAREEGGTRAVVTGAPDPLIGIHRDSTAQIDVRATWEEWTDAPAPSPGAEVVGSFAVDLDAPALPPVTHEFADTKRRDVTYHVTARSRFREFFAPSDPESAFARESSLPPVTVRSTARPAPPVVASVAPGLRWTVRPILGPPSDDLLEPSPVEGWVRTRAGGIVRVALARPWYTTGQGEQLGVVVSPGPGADALPRVPGAAGAVAAAAGAGSGLVTTLYRDPLFGSAAPVQPDHTTVKAGAGGAFVAADRESGLQICVVPVDVQFADGRWFADVEFTGAADESYSPLARLGLVRFQRGSVDGLEASPVVTTDLVPLLPTRRLGVQDLVSPVVTLEGTGPASGANVVEARLEVAPLENQAGDLTALDPAAASGWTIVRRVTGALGTPIALGDRPAGATWARVVVRELEGIPGSSASPPADALSGELASRVVFAGVVGI